MTCQSPVVLHSVHVQGWMWCVVLLQRAPPEQGTSHSCWESYVQFCLQWRSKERAWNSSSAHHRDWCVVPPVL